MSEVTHKPEIVLDPENPAKTLAELAEAASKLTPEQIEANAQRLRRIARLDKRPVPTRIRRIAGTEYGLHALSFVLVVQTVHHVRVELHHVTKQEYEYFCALFLPTNKTAKIEIRKRDFTREKNDDHSPAVRRFMREEAKKRGEFPA